MDRQSNKVSNGCSLEAAPVTTAQPKRQRETAEERAARMLVNIERDVAFLRAHANREFLVNGGAAAYWYPKVTFHPQDTTQANDGQSVSQPISA